MDLGFEHLVSIFYNGCTDSYKSHMDFGSRGSFLDLGVDECEKMLQRLAVNNKSWSSRRGKSMRIAATTDSRDYESSSSGDVVAQYKK